MEIITVLLLWLLLSAAVGVLANRYNRSIAGWIAFSIFLSPIMGFIFLLAAGQRPEHARHRLSEYRSEHGFDLTMIAVTVILALMIGVFVYVKRGGTFFFN